MSSAKGITHLSEPLFSRDCLDVAAAYFVSPAPRFLNPQPVDLPKFFRVQALHQKVRKPRTGFSR